MIDKIELRLPYFTTFQKDVGFLIREVDYTTYTSRVRKSQYYAGVANLRDLGIDALLHIRFKRGQGTHTGKKTYSQLAVQIERVMVGDINGLEMMRLDLCADIPNVPVVWFQSRMCFKHKRITHDIGPLRYEVIGKTVETLSAGRRPNIFRIYNKVEESKMQFRKMCKKASVDSDPLVFEKEFGFREDATLTRIERQHGGGRLPEQITTFGELHRAPDYNPFHPMEISTRESKRLPTVSECESLGEWLTGTGLNQA